jgi:hypothetical protein
MGGIGFVVQDKDMYVLTKRDGKLLSDKQGPFELVVQKRGMQGGFGS